MRKAAKQNDRVTGVDLHIEMAPSPGGPAPVSMVHAFNGVLVAKLSPTVAIDNFPAATVGSMAQNIGPHIPVLGPFQKPPSHVGTVLTGEPRVLINDKPAARHADLVRTCGDPIDLANSTIVVDFGTVVIG